MILVRLPIPFDRSGFGDTIPANIPVKKTDEEKIVETSKLNSRLTMNDMAIIIGKTRKTVMRLLKKTTKSFESVSIKQVTGKLKSRMLAPVIIHKEKRIKVGEKRWRH